ncbi:MAG: cellulase family glycosylhydrolase [Actinobacteria bacterium]|nr:cellulase family glycosylhydrolase [Actinomycetota bacterium]
MRRLLPIVCAAGILGSSVAATTASGASGLRVGITDDAWLEFGPSTLEARAARLKTLGADVTRVALEWPVIQPTRDTYAWERTDALLEALRTAGIVPVLSVWGTPAWANGGGRPNVAPSSAATFATFARAAAERYPWVRHWIIWNEPNQRRWLNPPSPVAYVTKLLNPAAAAIKSVIPKAAIAGGSTAPRGSQGGISPVDFIRGMGRAGARLDAYAHHPHPLSPAETPLTGGCKNCLTITLATLERLLDETRKAFGPRTRIWLSEVGFQTNPPDRILGVTWARQAQSLAEAQYRAYSGSRVDMLIQYLVRDEPRIDAWQSGLETTSGRAKPASLGFSLPLVQVSRNGSATKLWGQVRVGKGARPYVLQRRVGAAWRAVGSGGRTTARGFFTLTVRVEKGAQLRLLDPVTRRSSPALVVK